MIGGITTADKNWYEDYVFVFFTDRSQYVKLTMGGGKCNGKKQRI
jgi:hypothetical protein